MLTLKKTNTVLILTSENYFELIFEYDILQIPTVFSFAEFIFVNGK